MQSFASFLKEDRVSWLKDNVKEIDTSHDDHGEHKEPHAIIDHFASHDPSRKKIYTQWMIKQYQKQNIRQEDAPRVGETLGNFEKYKGRLDRKDINQYHHVADLDTALDPHLGKAASKKEEKRQIKHEGADLIHDEDGLSVHKLKTKEAACFYGSNTKWCTAGKNNNYFDHYNKQGPLYVVSNSETGRKWQLHFASGQYADEQDRNHPLMSIVAQNPGLRNVKEFKAKHHAFASPEEFNKAIASGHAYDTRKSAIAEDHEGGILTGKSLEMAYHHWGNKGSAGNEHVNAIAGHPNTPEHVMKTIATTNPSAHPHIAGNKNATSDVLEHVHDQSSKVGGSTHDATVSNLAKHPNTPEHLLGALYDPKASGSSARKQVHESIAANPRTPSATIDKMIANDTSLHTHVLKNPNTSPEQIQRIHDVAVKAGSNLASSQSLEAVALHPKTPGDILHALAHGSNHLAASNALTNPNTPVHTFETIHENGTDPLHAALAKSSATPTHILEKLTTHKLPFIAETAKRNLKGRK